MCAARQDLQVIFVYCLCRSWNYPLHKFDPKLNSDHLQHCLSKVIWAEEGEREEGVVSSSSSSAAEFEAYFLLSNVGKGYHYSDNVCVTPCPLSTCAQANKTCYIRSSLCPVLSGRRGGGGPW